MDEVGTSVSRETSLNLKLTPVPKYRAGGAVMILRVFARKHSQIAGFVVSWVTVVMMDDMVGLKLEISRYNGASDTTAITPFNECWILASSKVALLVAEELGCFANTRTMTVNLNAAMRAAKLNMLALRRANANPPKPLTDHRWAHADLSCDLPVSQVLNSKKASDFLVCNVISRH